MGQGFVLFSEENDGKIWVEAKCRLLGAQSESGMRALLGEKSRKGGWGAVIGASEPGRSHSPPCPQSPLMGSLANQDVRWMLTITQMVNRRKKHKENISVYVMRCAGRNIKQESGDTALISELE